MIGTWTISKSEFLLPFSGFKIQISQPKLEQAAVDNFIYFINE